MSQGGRPDDYPLRPLAGNPYLEAWERSMAGARPVEDPDELVATFGFAVPTPEALLLIAAHSPQGVIELGAGTGYWARMLHEHHVDVVAYDIAPPPSEHNTWFAGRHTWFRVEVGDERVVAMHPERTLLLVWPTWNESWAADAAKLHLDNSGRYLVYVGERPGGRTGDLRLHALLDLVGPCLACSYGVDNVPCTCDVTARWRLRTELPLPSFDDRDDQHLYVFAAPGPSTQRARRRGWRRWRLRR